MHLVIRALEMWYCRNFVGLKLIYTKCTAERQQHNYPAILNSYCLGLESYCKQTAKNKLNQCRVNWQGFFRMHKCPFIEMQTNANHSKGWSLFRIHRQYRKFTQSEAALSCSFKSEIEAIELNHSEYQGSSKKKHCPVLSDIKKSWFKPVKHTSLHPSSEGSEWFD